MNATIPLGRIAGVRVGLHWSVAGIVALVAVGLASVQLPAAFPGHSPVGYTLAGLATATLLLGSLLTHELAHALVARRNAVDVDGITLWLLGGVAQLRGEARTPGADLRIAGIGPMTSGALALVFGLLGWLVHLADAHVLVVAVLGYLALLNVVLAVFNLLPAAPLDGGRVLRAVLWWWRGDRYQAALWSARAGLGLGGLLVLGGVVQLFRQSTEGLWTILRPIPAGHGRRGNTPGPHRLSVGRHARRRGHVPPGRNRLRALDRGRGPARIGPAAAPPDADLGPLRSGRRGDQPSPVARGP